MPVESWEIHTKHVVALFLQLLAVIVALPIYTLISTLSLCWLRYGKQVSSRFVFFLAEIYECNNLKFRPKLLCTPLHWEHIRESLCDVATAFLYFRLQDHIPFSDTIRLRCFVKTSRVVSRCRELLLFCLLKTPVEYLVICSSDNQLKMRTTKYVCKVLLDCSFNVLYAKVCCNTNVARLSLDVKFPKS